LGLAERVVLHEPRTAQTVLAELKVAHLRLLGFLWLVVLVVEAGSNR
jgi:hypothetical protein